MKPIHFTKFTPRSPDAIQSCLSSHLPSVETNASFHSLSENNVSSTPKEPTQTQQSTKLNTQAMSSLNARFWLTYRSLGQEIAHLGEQDGYRLRVKNKDANRAIVSCAKSGFYQTTGKVRSTKTQKCGCDFKILLKRKGNDCFLKVTESLDSGHWKIYRFQNTHNHDPLSAHDALKITSYRQLSTGIWSDIRLGVSKGHSFREITQHRKDAQPLARRVTDLVFKNAIQKCKREFFCKREKMSIEFLLD